MIAYFTQEATALMQHLINSRPYSLFKPEEYSDFVNHPQSSWFDLSFLSVIELSGEAAANFLQGQLTCDLRLVSEQRMIQGAQCDLKGRILSLVDVLNWQGYKLVLPTDLASSTLKSLLMTARLSKVGLELSTKFKCYGFYSPQEQQAPLYTQDSQAQYCSYHLGAGFYIFIVQNQFEEEFFKHFKTTYPLLGSLTWHSLRLAQKQINIYPESKGLFLPHRLGLQETQYLSFNKGCYKGQEIIARTHYRAILKHELKLYQIKTTEPLLSGQKLLDTEQGSEIGELVDYAPLGDGVYLIAAIVLQDAPIRVQIKSHTQCIFLEQFRASS